MDAPLARGHGDERVLLATRRAHENEDPRHAMFRLVNDHVAVELLPTDRSELRSSDVLSTERVEERAVATGLLSETERRYRCDGRPRQRKSECEGRSDTPRARSHARARRHSLRLGPLLVQNREHALS